MDDILKRAVTNGWIGAGENEYQFDGWGRRLIYVGAHETTWVSVRIISVGANGIFEWGIGDDFFVEVAYTAEQPPSITYTPWSNTDKKQ
jgi:hypothetical protein